MIEPKTVELGGKTYLLGKFPATVGREILMQYPTSAMPKIGDYKTNHALMLRIMSYVGVQVEGREEPLMLTTEALVNNHVTNAETLVKLEWAMVQHNFDFFYGWARVKLPRIPDAKSPIASVRNVDEICAALIGANLATLQELRTVYTLQDALQMFEVLVVQRANEYAAATQK